MLNEEKVKYMTKAAAYENGPEKKNIGISSYFRADYLGLQLVKSAVAYTVSFAILAGMWAMGQIEDLMLMLSRAEYLEKIIRVLIILFVSGLAIYEIGIYAYYSWRFKCAKHSVGGFHGHLKRIHKFYEIQESAGTADEENTL